LKIAFGSWTTSTIEEVGTCESTQSASYCPLSWSEDRADEQHLGVLPDAF
jgi:hypothetical protein